MKFVLLPLFLLVFLSPTSLHAQVPEPDTSSVWIIETITGSTYEGYIMEMDSFSVTVKTEGGTTITLSREIIENMRQKVSNTPSAKRNQRPTVNRYNFSGSAHSLGKNNGYYRNNTIFINEAAYGLGSNFDLELSTTFILTPAYIRAKYSIPLVENELTASVTAGAIVIPFIVDGTTANAGYSIGAKFTFGPKHRNLTFGYQQVGDQPFESAVNIFNISGKIDLNYKFSIVGDMVIFTEPNANIFTGQNTNRFSFLSIGARFRMRKVSLDVSPTILNYTDSFSGNVNVIFPMLNLVVPF